MTIYLSMHRSLLISGALYQAGQPQMFFCLPLMTGTKLSTMVPRCVPPFLTFMQEALILTVHVLHLSLIAKLHETVGHQWVFTQTGCWLPDRQKSHFKKGLTTLVADKLRRHAVVEVYVSILDLISRVQMIPYNWQPSEHRWGSYYN